MIRQAEAVRDVHGGMDASADYARLCVATIGEEDASALRAHLTATERVVWISRRTRCVVHHLRRASAREIDVLVDPVAYDPRGLGAPHLWVVEVGRKRGRYDGAERWRLTLRLTTRAARAGYGGALVDGAALSIEERERSYALRLTCGVDLWSAEVTAHRADLRYSALAPIVMHHAAAWYKHLLSQHPEDVEALAAGMTALPGETLAEANRRVSRELYRLSRDRGWRKLTLRERERLGIHGGEWQRVEAVDAIRLARGAS